jgi:TP901 family phage tail tape measure protein
MLEQLRGLALKMGADTQYSATEAAEGITAMGKAGVSAKDILGGGLKGALDLAAAGQLSVADSAEIAATAMTQFGLAGSDLPHVADLFAAAAGKAQGSVKDISEAMKFAGPEARALGISIEETTGVIAEFASKGIIGSMAGESLRGILVSLTSPSELAKKKMAELGISVYDANGKFIGLSGIAQQLHDKLGPLDEATRNAAMGQIFSNAQITQAQILYEGGSAAVQEWTGKVNDAGFAAEQAAKLTDNLKGDIERLGGSIDTALIQTGSKANDTLRGMTQGLNGVVDGFGNLAPIVQENIIKLAAVSSGLLLVGGAALIAVPKVLAFKTAIEAANISFGKFTGAMKVAGASLGVIGLAYASTEIRNMAAASAVGTPPIDKLAASLQAVGAGAQSSGDFGALFARGAGVFRNNFEDASKALDDFGANANAALNSHWYESLLGSEGEAKSVFSTRIAQIDKALADLVSSGHGAEAAAAVDKLSQSIEQYGGSADQVKGQLTQYNAAVKEGGDATGAAKAPVTDLTAAADAQRAAMDALNNTTDKWIETMNAVNSPVLSARDAVRQWEASIDAAQEALKENGKTLDVTTDKGRKNQAALDDMAKAALSNVGAMQANGASQGQLQGALDSSRIQLYNTARQFGLSETAAHEYVDQVLKIPPKASTTAEFNDAQARAEVASFQAYVMKLHGTTVPVYASVESGIRHAAGGLVTGPGTGTSDDIPARLSNREYVVKATAVEKYGVHFLDQVNSMRFANGGYAAYGPATSGVSTSSLSLDGMEITGSLAIGGDGLATIIDGRIVRAVQGARSASARSGKRH